MLVRAIIVNHNTSEFAQLALRSLFSSHARDSDVDLQVSVVDNHSSDDGLDELRSVCKLVGADFSASRWPAEEANVNTHGDVLRDFVLDHSDADYFLFIDSDIDFEEPAIITTMTEDVRSDEARWAVQARFKWPEENLGKDASLDIWAGREIAVRVGREIDHWTNENTIQGSIQRRCHPGATLCTNTDLFRRVADVVGFSCAVRMSADSQHAGFFDTFGLASTAMEAAGLRYALSRATVHHFFMASYDDEQADRRRADCRNRLARFAASTSG